MAIDAPRPLFCISLHLANNRQNRCGIFKITFELLIWGLNTSALPHKCNGNQTVAG